MSRLATAFTGKEDIQNPLGRGVWGNRDVGGDAEPKSDLSMSLYRDRGTVGKLSREEVPDRMMEAGLSKATRRCRREQRRRPGEMEMRWLGKTLKAACSTAVLLGFLAAVFLVRSSAAGFAQQTASSEAAPLPGDQPSDPGPLATGLSPDLNSKQIRAVMRKVADWELQRVQSQAPSRAWDFGALDIGLMAASRTLHDQRYSQYVASVGEHFGWKLERTTYPANDFAIAPAWIEVYRSSHKEE